MIARLRGDSTMHAVPIVTISTEAAGSDTDRAYEAGADLYLVKPAPPATLIETARLLTGVAA